MKKVITLMLFVCMQSITCLFVFMLYQGSKQTLIAYEVFHNSIEVLRSRNFSSQSIETLQKDSNFRFEVTKLASLKYQVTMNYRIGFQKEKMTLQSIVYQQQ